MRHTLLSLALISAACTADNGAIDPTKPGGGGIFHPDGRCLYLLTSAEIVTEGHTLDFEISKGGQGWQGSLSVDGERWQLEEDGEAEWIEKYGYALVRFTAGEDRELRVYARTDKGGARMSFHEAGVDEVGTPEHQGSVTDSSIWTLAGTWAFWDGAEKEVVAEATEDGWEERRPCL